MKFDIDSIRQRIQEAVLKENDLSEEVAQDIAFHMTDWLEDLENILNFVQILAN